MSEEIQKLRTTIEWQGEIALGPFSIRREIEAALDEAETLSARLREAEAIIDKLPSQIHIIQKLLLDGGEAEAFEVMDQIKNKALAAEQKEAESDEQA